LKIDEQEYLEHYGTPRHSGRYPWGSSGWGDGGTESDQRNPTLLDRINELKKQGLSEKAIADGMGMTLIELRSKRSVANAQRKQSNIIFATRLKEKGMSNTAIGERMGVNESVVRSWLRPGELEKTKIIDTTAQMLREEVDKKPFLDIGRGTENRMGVTANKLNSAVAILKAEGYEVHKVQDPLALSGHKVTQKVLVPAGVTQKDVWLNRDKILPVGQISDDGGRTFQGMLAPKKISPSRVHVVYGSDGSKADGMIYVRPGVADVSLGGSNYAQVRIAVGNNHYLKGMAMYKDDLPEGSDLQFNTAKEQTRSKLDAFKENEDDPLNPFGTFIDRQIIEHPGTSREKVTSVMNIVNEEGQWEKWSRNLSSQMLSKQSPALAKSQLDMTYERRERDFDNIMALTNPVVKKKLLETFADSTDNASVHLKAAALPRQGIHVILPIETMPETEVYAPNYFPGEKVVLIRHPHGGTFEIPELIVNNNHAEAKKLLGNSKDAIGINHRVAKRMSGADFDGDTVMVIPDPQGRIKSSPPLEALKNFDPIAMYPGTDDSPKMTKDNLQNEMGKISNLITDMSIHRAPVSEIARAIKHSMVVIDSYKHGLNYKQSFNDNGIKELKKKYQVGGASTLISRAKGRKDVPARRARPHGEGGPINKQTGAREWVPTGETRAVKKVNKETGEVTWGPERVQRMTKSTKLAEATDARSLMSGPDNVGTIIERMYADHSNKLKTLANRARLESTRTPTTKQSPTARATYAKEVASLDAKIALARTKAPLERQAQRIAKSEMKERRAHNPNISDDSLNKMEYQALEKARARLGIKKNKEDYEITQSEWDAIQADAISPSKLSEMLRYADIDHVRKLATPKDQPLMGPAQRSRARTMAEQGYTRGEIAATLGVSLTTLENSIAVKEK